MTRAARLALAPALLVGALAPVAHAHRGHDALTVVTIADDGTAPARP